VLREALDVNNDVADDVSISFHAISRMYMIDNDILMLLEFK